MQIRVPFFFGLTVETVVSKIRKITVNSVTAETLYFHHVQGGGYLYITVVVGSIDSYRDLISDIPLQMTPVGNTVVIAQKYIFPTRVFFDMETTLAYW